MERTGYWKFLCLSICSTSHKLIFDFLTCQVIKSEVQGSLVVRNEIPGDSTEIIELS